MAPAQRNAMRASIRVNSRLLTAFLSVVLAMCLLAGPVGATTFYWETDSITNLADPTQNYVGAAVACASSSFCVMTTDQQTPVIGSHPTIDQYDSTTWQMSNIEGTVNDQNNGHSNAVACAAVGRCIVVGDVRHGDRTMAFVSELKDGHWTAAVIGNSLSYGKLSTITCLTPEHCVAAGEATTTNNVHQALVAEFKNAQWSVSVVGKSLNTGHHASLITSSCTATGFCVFGGAVKQGSDLKPLLVTKDATGLHASVQGTFINHGIGWFAGSSCWGTVCHLVGTITDSSGYNEPALATVTRSSASTIDLAKPLGLLNSISCVGASCMMVGEVLPTTPLVGKLTSNGKVVWKKVTKARSDLHPMELASVSCISQSQCFAVGQTMLGVDAGVRADLVSIDGASVSADLLGPPTYAGGTDRPAMITCLSDGFCHAAGTAVTADTQHESAWLAVRFAG